MLEGSAWSVPVLLSLSWRGLDELGLILIRYDPLLELKLLLPIFPPSFLCVGLGWSRCPQGTGGSLWGCDDVNPHGQSIPPGLPLSILAAKAVPDVL